MTTCFLEIKQLFGYDPSFKWRVAFLVVLQIASLEYLKDKSIGFLFVAAYCFGLLTRSHRVSAAALNPII